MGLLIALALTLGPKAAWAADYVLIRNAQMPTSTVSASEVRQLFIGEIRQWGGSVAQPVSASDLLTRIKQEVFRGNMKRPVVARTTEECIAAVARVAGAIGVVDAEAAKALPAGVLLLTVKD
jgi:hypothetical protein